MRRAVSGKDHHGPAHLLHERAEPDHLIIGMGHHNYGCPQQGIKAGHLSIRCTIQLCCWMPNECGEALLVPATTGILRLSMANLQVNIENFYAARPLAGDDAASARQTFAAFRDALTAGSIRAAEKHNGEWRVNAWVKKGILLGFRLGELQEMGGAGPLSFVDKSTFPARRFETKDNVRVVPGGSSVRQGAYLASGVICMPPMYVNVGAYVDQGTLIDSHALVGSCAQIGKRVHLSAAAQVGGVLEPVNASPVIIEDDVLIGGNCGIYEGTQVGARAVLGWGTILTRSTPLYDLVHGRVY